MPDRVNAAVHLAQPAELQATVDRVTTNAKLQQLGTADHAVLAFR